MQKETESEEKEIEELVGETIEGNIRKDAKLAEKIINENKAKEEISKKVFSSGREEFLAAGKDRDLKPKIGIFSQLKGFFTGDIEIKESDTRELFDQFELALMESDVSYQTSQALVSDLKSRLIGKKVRSGKIQEEVRREIAFALASIFQTSKSSFYEKINESKSKSQLPFIVLFLGPNGMGKTTTIAKIAHNLKKRGITSVISASDTFRAAAIEQSVIHGEKLGIKIIKHTYGSDPAAVAFDAINYAKSHGIDVVLIDTAGRQDTNINLLMEMQKIVRVVKPSLKVFIAEAIAGSSLVNQVRTFNEKLGLDGIVLTKLDCDAKGGGSLSIAYECKLPVYFVGVGQGYDDLLEFNEEWIIKNIMAE
ncbi:signal recognition particle-docking protein FtsY [Candidatus Micrarchaeota archaeon]|nr:signal recognition particle-docking protein FtsY [Candidatus Micrarchaeota archaeon]